MIPWTLKKWWQMRLLDVVQEWAGVGTFHFIFRVLPVARFSPNVYSLLS